MFRPTRRRFAELALLAPALMTRRARADEPVTIGVIYPLTGPGASAGVALKLAVETAIDIVNTPHPELANLPLAATAGLPNLGSRPVAALFADHQGSPAIAQSETLRMITQDHVVAMFGAYQSGAVLTASAVAEHAGIPFVAAEATAPTLTERGFQWFFRTTPTGTEFGRLYADFLKMRKTQGQRIETIALVSENSEYGSTVGNAISKALDEQAMKVSLHITYNANSSDVSAHVLQVKQANPDVLIFVSYTSDAILFLRTMHALDDKPPILIGDDSGFSDPAFIAAAGDLAQGVLNRSSYTTGKPGTASFIVNALYRKRAGHDLDDTSARGLQGFLVLCDALNRAGATDPAKLQAALRTTDLKPEQLMIGYKGVRFDAKGQIETGATLLVQLHGRHYMPVWPQASADENLILPFQGWK